MDNTINDRTQNASPTSNRNMRESFTSTCVRRRRHTTLPTLLWGPIESNRHFTHIESDCSTNYLALPCASPAELSGLSYLDKYKAGLGESVVASPHDPNTWLTCTLPLLRPLPAYHPIPHEYVLFPLLVDHLPRCVSSYPGRILSHQLC